jgi:hypothetical protein
MYTGRQMMDTFEISLRLNPLSCDQRECPVSVVLKESVDTFLLAFLYTRVLARVLSMERRKFLQDSWDEVVKMEEPLPLLAVTRRVMAVMGRSDPVGAWLSLATVEGVFWTSA